MVDVVIVSASRTAMGKFNGSLKDLPAPKLGSIVVKDAVEKAGISPEDVQEVLMGLVVSAGLGQNPARQAALGAGLPVTSGAATINKVCGSGMKTIMTAANAIKAEEYDTIVAGGMENMTRTPYLLQKGRSGYRLGNDTIVDAMVNDGLWDVYNDFHMGMTGERIAEHYNLTREELDEFSANSHKKALETIEAGGFKDEIVPIEIPQRKGDPIIFDTDEGPRAGTSAEKLARLKPAFKKDGIITAGNASQLSDGAAAMVLMSAEKAEERGIKPLAKILAYHTSGVAPEDVMEAPVPAIRDILKKAGLTVDDIDVWEHNEAFSSASVAVQKEFGIPDEKFNVHGGAVALGHPIGASGTRVVVTLLHAMKQKGAKRGLATLCLGGGNAVAMILEM